MVVGTRNIAMVVEAAAATMGFSSGSETWQGQTLPKEGRRSTVDGRWIVNKRAKGRRCSKSQRVQGQ